MTFALAPDPTTPQHSTVEAYTLSRLGQFPALTALYAETADGWQNIAVDSATDPNSDGKFESVVMSAWLDNPSGAVGKKLYDLASGTFYGTIQSYAVTAASGASPAFGTALLGSGEGLPTGAAQTVKTELFNPFGVQGQFATQNGRHWSLTLQSAQSDHLSRMNSILGTVMFEMVKLGLAKLGNTSYTDAQIQSAVQGMNQDGNSIDSLIASQLEQLEQDRRNGVFTAAYVGGQVP